jgi:MGT family glycosyltransferase
MPATGHINPGLPIAQELIRRGHDVRWYSAPMHQKSIEATGARFVSFDKCRLLSEEWTQEHFEKRKGLKGLALMRQSLKGFFIEPVRDFLADLEEVMRREPFDLVIGCNTAGVGGLLKERYGIPWVAYGITVYTLPSRDMVPFGLGAMPSSSTLGRIRNRALRLFTEKVAFRELNTYHAELRAELGFSNPQGSVFDVAVNADAYLQGSIPEFEFPISDLAPNVKFIGSTPPPPPAHWTPPTWWKELDGSKPVILVTQGTVANDYDDLIRPAIRALANRDCHVIVTTGSKPAEMVEIDPLPENVRVEQFIPYAHLMPKVDLLVTNGGYGSIQIALLNGIPMVAIGATEDKAEIANRVNWTGVGVAVKKKTADEPMIRTSVDRVLGDASFRLRAMEMQRKLAMHNPAVEASDVIETLLPRVTQAPLLSRAGA